MISISFFICVVGSVRICFLISISSLTVAVGITRGSLSLAPAIADASAAFLSVSSFFLASLTWLLEIISFFKSDIKRATSLL